MNTEYSKPFRLPFSGFFMETDHNYKISTLLVTPVNEKSASDEIDITPAIVWNDHIPRWELELAYVKAWVSVLARETGSGIVFDALHTGSRLYGTIPVAELEAMANGMDEAETIDWTTLVASDRKTGKSGLIPHPVLYQPPCSRDVGKWGPVATWKQGQHGFLFDFNVSSQIDDNVLADGAVEILHDIIPKVFINEFRNPRVSDILQGSIDKAIRAWDDEHPVSGLESDVESGPEF